MLQALPTLPVEAAVVVAAVVSFVIAAPIVRLSNSKQSLEDSTEQMKEMKAQAKGVAASEVKTVADSLVSVAASDVNHIVFACDAGMGSSAMGATVLRKKLTDVGRTDVKVDHASVSEIPADAQIVVVHQDLAARARKSAPNARLVTISNFMSAPEYDQIAQELRS